MCHLMRLVLVFCLFSTWIPWVLAQSAVKKQPGFYQFVPLIFVFFVALCFTDSSGAKAS